MPLWVGSILGGLIQVAGTLVGKVLLSLGFSYVTFTALDTSLTWLKQEVIAGLAGTPALFLQVLGLMQVGTCISILFSALAARLLLMGMTNGTLTRLVNKG